MRGDGRIKGITIELSAGTTGLAEALGEIDGKSAALQKELKSVNALLKFDPANTALLAQKQELLAQKTELAKTKAEALEKAQEDVQKAIKIGDISEKEYRGFVRETEASKNALKQLEKEMDDVEKASKDMGFAAEESMEDAADESENLLDKLGDLQGGFSGLKDGLLGIAKAHPAGAALAAIGTAAVGAAKAINDVVEETREYREDMNKLETAFTTAGKTVEMAKESYSGFYAILGESDRSVEAANHLAKLCNTEEELAMWSDICAGVTATFGDSLPIEGLTEAANETAKVGSVTGPLADALNWAGISEDKFNESLAACSGEQERSRLITETLNKTYMDASEKYKTLNKDIIKSREATQKMAEVQAALGAKFEPVMSMMKDKAADFAMGAAEAFGIVADETDKIAEKTRSLSEAHEENRKSIEEKEAAQLGELVRIQSLKGELETLVDENGRVTDKNKARAQYILGELNTALGTEYSMNGNIIDSMGKICSSIDEVIAKRRAEILLSAQEEKFAEAVKKEGEARAVQTEALNQLIQKRNELAQIKENVGTDETKIRNAANHMSQLSAEIATLEQSYADASETVAQYSTDTQTYHEACALATEGDINGLIALLDNQNGKFIAAADVAAQSADEQKRVLGQQYADAITAAKVAADNYDAVQTEQNKKLLDEALARAQNAKEQYRNVGGAMVDGCVEGVNNKKINLFNTLGNVMTSSLQLVKNLIDSRSPSRVFRDEVGAMIVAGIEVGITDNEYKVTDATKRMFDNLDLQKDLGVISEEEYYNRMAELRDNYIKQGTKEWWDYTKKLIKYEDDRKKSVEKAEDDWEKGVLRDMKWELDMGYLTEDEYYKRLGEIKDKFYEKDSPEWQATTLELKKYNDSAAEDAKNQVRELAEYAAEMAALDFDLWSLTEGKNADEWTKQQKQKEMLTDQLEQQSIVVDELTKAYEEMTAAKGADAEESRELAKRLKEEKIAQAELSNQIDEIDKTSAVNPMEAGRDFSRWLGKYAQQFRDFGYSNTELYKIGAQATGYDKVIGEEGMKNIKVEQNLVFQSNAMTPSKVAQESKTALRQAALSF